MSERLCCGGFWPVACSLACRLLCGSAALAHLLHPLGLVFVNPGPVGPPPPVWGWRRPLAGAPGSFCPGVGAALTLSFAHCLSLCHPLRIPPPPEQNASLCAPGFVASQAVARMWSSTPIKESLLENAHQSI